jgi:hypothetical protein
MNGPTHADKRLSSPPTRGSLAALPYCADIAGVNVLLAIVKLASSVLVVPLMVNAVVATPSTNPE